MSKLDEARKKTDRQLAELEQKIRDFYKTAEKEIRKKWDEYINDILHQKTNDAWTNLKQAEKSGNAAAIKKAKKIYQDLMNESVRTDRYFQGMVNQVAENITHANEIALAYINGEMPEFYAINLNAANQHISEYVAGYRFDLMDADTARLLLTEDNFYTPLFKTVDKAKDKTWNVKLIHSQMAQGILQGESIPRIAERIKNVTGANEASSIRHARTMCTAAENRGRMDGFERAESSGIVLKKEWIATVGDGRTRDWHLNLDGQTKPVDEPFKNQYGDIMYPGDFAAHPANVWNCRCTIGTEIVGFKRKDGSISYIEGKEGEEDGEEIQQD